MLTFGLAAVALLIGDRVSLRAAELAFVGGLAAFVAWVALSNLWTASMTSSMREVQRNLAYVGLTLLGVVITRHRTVAFLLGGVTTAVTALCGYGLATRLLPDRFGTFAPGIYKYRLSPPIGYWNGLGIFAVMGMLLALGFALRGRRIATRTLAGAAIPVLSTTMFFTFSRGAWIALGIGLFVFVAVDHRRLQAIAIGTLLAVWPAVAIIEAHQRRGLTRVDSTISDAVRDGHSLVWWIVPLTVASAAAALGGAIAERRIRIPPTLRTAFAVIVVAAAASIAAGIWVTEGSPWHLADKAWNQFADPPTKPSTDITQRLFSFRSNGRVDLYRVSLRSFERSPFLGNGAGTFRQLWLRDRHAGADTNEAHSLYIGVLGQLGLPGLLVLLTALLTPLVVAVRRRSDALVPPALGAYSAWVVHTGVDWDWSLLAVGACGLLIGVGLLGPRDRPVRPPFAAAAVAGCVSIAALAFIGLLGDRAIQAARVDIARGDERAAVSHLRRASRLAPWSSEPDLLKGSLLLGTGNRSGAQQAFRDALRKDRRNWLVWYDLSRVTSGRTRERNLAQARRLNIYIAPSP